MWLFPSVGVVFVLGRTGHVTATDRIAQNIAFTRPAVSLLRAILVFLDVVMSREG